MTRNETDVARSGVARAGNAPLAVRMTGIEKSFGAVRANHNASLEVRPGEIHALVGENGAGKSTLLRVLGGLTRPDAGTVEVNGRDVTGWSAADAIRAGVGIVHQHFMLVPTLTVAENLVLGTEPTRRGAVDYARARDEVRRLGEETGLAIDGSRRVSELSVGEAQRVEILKTLYRGARILVLDEPTAVLSPPEVHDLVSVLRRVRDAGSTIILVTHRLDEVMALSERITVMRSGETVAVLATAETSPSEIARAMVGRDVLLTTRPHRGRPAGQQDAGAQAVQPALEVRDLVVRGARGTRDVDAVSFDVLPGEIFGIAGVEGNGQSELMQALAGLCTPVSGSIRVGGSDITRTSVRERHASGMSHIPEDRQHRGLVLDYSVADNLVLGLQSDFTHAGVLDRAAVTRNAELHIAAFDIRPADAALPARALSGGNQQKVVIAREMGRSFSVLLAAQPTRGVDVGAIEFIHQRLLAARESGKAIVLVSAELNEILSLADRVAVMYRGKLVAVMPAADATEAELGEYMIGAKHGAAA